MPESVSPDGAPPKRARVRKSSAKKKASPDTSRPDGAPASVEVSALRLTAVDRRSMIAAAAYYRAERRRFQSGHELEDWLAAEAEIEALLRVQTGAAKGEAGPA